MQVEFEPRILCSSSRKHTTLQLDQQAALACVVTLMQHMQSGLTPETVEDRTVDSRTAVYEACQIPAQEDDVSAFLSLLGDLRSTSKSMVAAKSQMPRTPLQKVMALLQHPADEQTLSYQSQQIQQLLSAAVPKSVIGKQRALQSLQQMNSHNLVVVNHLTGHIEASTAAASHGPLSNSAFALLGEYMKLLKAARKAYRVFADFMWSTADQLPEGLRQHTPEIIQRLEHLTKTFVASVCITEDSVRLVQAFPTNFFMDAQQQLNDCMAKFGISQEQQAMHGLHKLFSQFGVIDWGQPGATAAPQEAASTSQRALQAQHAGTNPIAMRQAAFEERRDKIKASVAELLQKAHALDVPCISLLRSIRRMQAKLERSSDHLSDYSLKQWHFDVSQLQQKLKEYEASLAKKDPLLSRVAHPGYYTMDFSIPAAAWVVTEQSLVATQRPLAQLSSEIQKVCA